MLCFQFLPICCKENILLVFEFAFPSFLLRLNIICLLISYVSSLLNCLFIKINTICLFTNCLCPVFLYVFVFFWLICGNSLFIMGSIPLWYVSCIYLSVTCLSFNVPSFLMYQSQMFFLCLPRLSESLS